MEDLVLPVAKHGGKSIFELGFLCQGHLSVSFGQVFSMLDQGMPWQF